MSRRLLGFVRIVGTVLLFGYVLWKAGLFTQAGWRNFIDTIGGVGFGFLALALLSNLVLDIISTLKWWQLSRALGLRSSFGDLLAAYLSGRFFNLVLPSNIGGDIIRIAMQGGQEQARALSAASVFMDRLTGFVTLVALALAVSAVTAPALRIPHMGLAIAVSALGVAVLIWMILDVRPLERCRAIAVAILPATAALFDKLRKMHDALGLYRHHRGAIAASFATSLLFHLACGVSFWLNLAAFDPATPLLPIMLATPLVMVIMNIPLTIGNVGLMEFAYTMVFGAFGIPPSVALSGALLHRLKSFIAAGLGGLLYNVVKLRMPLPAGADLRKPGGVAKK